MTSLARPLLTTIALSLAVAGFGAASAAVPGAESDVRLLAQQLEAIHPDVFDNLDRSRFRATVNGVAARADELAENELLVELMRIAALPGIGNGHSGIFPGDPAHSRDLHLYPLRLYEFPDGTHVVGERGNDGLVGARITAIGGTPYAEVAKRVRPLVPHDNAWNLKGYLPHWVLTAEVLDGLGIADGLSPLEFTFTQRGRQQAVTLSPIPAGAYVSAFRDPLHGHYPSVLPRRKPMPMYLQKSSNPRWWGMLEGGKTLFIGFNSVQPWDTRVLGRIERSLKKPALKRVVVDLRLNGGGNNQSYGTLLDILRKSAANRKGRMAVLIGRATFSAAANFAADMDRYTKATFFGEPTGGFVRGYGDTIPIALPKSGITVHIATRYWDFSKGSGDRRLAVNADRKVNVTLADFLAGRDPVLAAALSR